MPVAHHIDHHTEAFGTVITELIPPVSNRIAKLTSLVYTAAGTVHDLILMRAIHRVETTAAAAAAATSLVLSEATFGGDTLASGDYVCVEHSDGTYGLHLVSNLATLTITINALAKAVSSGADVWIFGAPSDSSYHLTLKSIASTRIEFKDEAAGLITSGYDIGTFDRDGLGDPLMFYSANGTAAGVLNWGAAKYVTLRD